MAFVLKFSPTSEGYAEEHIEFTQADRKITFVNRFDSYEVLTDEVDLTDDFFESKELLNYNPKKGIRTNLFHWTSEKEGERVKYRIKGAVDREEKQELIEAFKEMYESGVEDLGWEWSDRDLYYFGAFEILDLRTGLKKICGC
jgi:hypothetical protein